MQKKAEVPVSEGLVSERHRLRYISKAEVLDSGSQWATRKEETPEHADLIERRGKMKMDRPEIYTGF